MHTIARRILPLRTVTLICAAISALSPIALAGTPQPPSFAYQSHAHFPGTPYGSFATEVTNDAAGNLLALGRFSGSTDFDMTTGVSVMTTTEYQSVFIAKYSPSNQLLWTKKIVPDQPSSDLSLQGVHTDSAGAIFIFGSIIGSVDMDPGAGVFNLVELNQAAGLAPGDYDGFIAKYDASGAFQWAFIIGAPNPFCGQFCPSYAVSDVVTDASNNVFVTGDFGNNGLYSTDFDPGSGTVTRPNAGSADVYLAKYSSAGVFLGVTSFGGPSDDTPSALRLSSNNTLVLSGGFTGSVDFDASDATTILHANGANTDFFAARYTTELSLVWAVGGGGSSANENYFRFAEDPSGNLYLISTIKDAGMQVDFDPGAGSAVFTGQGSGDIVIVKLNASGGFVWAKHLATPGYEGGLDAQIDSEGNPWFALRFYGNLDLDPNAGTHFINGNNAGHAVVKLSPAGELLEVYNFSGANYANAYELSRLHFATPTTLLVNGTVTGTADMNPGIGSALVTSANSSTLYPDWVLTTLIRIAPPIVGDIDGNGSVGGADLARLLGAWGTNNAAADLNRDGTVDGIDLGPLLSNWS